MSAPHLHKGILTYLGICESAMQRVREAVCEVSDCESLRVMFSGKMPTLRIQGRGRSITGKWICHTSLVHHR